MNLEFFIRMRDLVSGGLVKMAQTAKKTSDQVKGANGMLSQSYDQIKQKVLDLESAISKSTSVKHIREARRELEQLQRMQTKHPAHMGGGSWVGNGIRQALPMMGLAGALALGGSMLSSGLDQQARQVSFEVMAGKEGGTRLNNDLTAFAQDSIYGNEVYQNAQTMLGFGIADKDVMNNMKMLGDIAMGDANKLGSLTLAFSQVKAAGKLTGQDLLQFVNTGFNPLQVIAEKTGMKMGDLKEAVSDGAISFEMVEAAFKSATGEGGRFHDMTNKIAQTDYGKLQAFMGQLSGLGMKIGGILAPALGLALSILDPLIDLVSSSITFLQQHADMLGLVAVVLGTAAAAYAIFTIAVSAGSVATMGAAAATALWEAAQWGLNLAMNMNPIGLVIGLIAGLVAGVVYAWNKFEGFRMAIWGLWGAFKQVFENIGGFFKKIFEPIFKAIDAFKAGDYTEAGKQVALMAYNLSPIGLAKNSAEYALDGGFTKGVQEAFTKETLDRATGKGSSVAVAEAATPAAAGANAAFADLSKYKSAGKDAEDSVRGATSGGPRTININGVKFAENIILNAGTMKEGVDEILDDMETKFLRILNSGAAVG